jgi:hypothetical protein
MAALYSHIVYAEAFGLELALRAAEAAPEGTLRDFAALQAKDEARHVAFFARVTEQLEPTASRSDCLPVLRAELAAVHDHDELLVHGQVLESAAQAMFVVSARRSLDAQRYAIRVRGSEEVGELLRCIVQYIGRDEARHLAFGSLCIRQQLADATPARRAELERRARTTAGLVHGAFRELSGSLARLGLPPETLLPMLWRAMDRQLAVIGFEIGTPPQALERSL